jgi:hypothetical protein
VLAAGNPVWPFASQLFGGRYCPLGPSLAYEPANLATGWKFMVDAVARPPIEIDGHLHVVSLGPLLLPLMLLLGSARVNGAFA